MVNSVAVDGDLPFELTEALLRGEAHFAADLAITPVAELVFVRSPHAHARILAVDDAAARAAPGVLGVYTAADMPTLTLHEIHIIPSELAPPTLARAVVRHVGEPVVAVVATSRAAATDAAEMVVVDYEPLPAVITAEQSVAADAPLLFPERATNIALSWEIDERDPAWFVDEPTPVTVRGELEIPRLSTAPMEGHAIVAVPTANDGVHVFVSTQSPHSARVQVARAFGLDLTQVRVQVPAVGGGFGGKSLGGVREHIATVAAARHLQMAVRFVELRTDNLQSMQGRGVRLRYEADATHDGRVTHLRVDDLCDCGAYPSTGTVEPGKTMLMASGPYRIGHVTFRARSAMTNLPPTGAYRGPGRSEAAAVLEQVMDRVAQACHLDPLEVRLRNLFVTGELPKETVTGAHYDETDFRVLVARAREQAGYDQWRGRQRRDRDGGGAGAGDTQALIGVGVSTVVDSTAWFDRVDRARLYISHDGLVHVELCSASMGQHHDRAIAGIVGDQLGVPVTSVRLREGDSELGSGMGSSGSRTAQLGGHATRVAAIEMRERLLDAAARRFEASRDDIVLHDGRAFVRGVPAAALTLTELAAELPDDDRVACGSFEQSAATYPVAVNVAVVAVDPETGSVTLETLVTVTDCGTLLDPDGAHGQVAGASVQGIAQALFERAAYDDAGNPRTSNLADYLMPSAADVPAVHVEFYGHRSSRNPLGAKGVGEIGMVAAPIAVHSAVLDALRARGVDTLAWPADPESVWRALQRR